MKIEWCVCDIDGTLLDSNSQLTTENIEAIQKLHAAGIKVVLATGRSDLFVKDVAHQLNVTEPIISCNGGMIRDITNGVIHFSKFIQHETAGHFITDCLENRRDMLAYSTDRIYYTPTSQRIHSYQQYNNKVIEAFQVPIQKISSVKDLPLTQLLKFFVSNVNDGLLTTLENTHNQERHLSMVRSQRGALDIMANDISKGEALRIYSQKLGMNLAKTVAFGDNYNDISMLLQADYPIAVANAEEAVKEVAKYITLSNDQSGVAYAIRNYILM